MARKKNGTVIGFWFKDNREEIKKKEYIKDTIKSMQEYKAKNSEPITKTEALYRLCRFFNEVL